MTRQPGCQFLHMCSPRCPASVLCVYVCLCVCMYLCHCVDICMSRGVHCVCVSSCPFHISPQWYMFMHMCVFVSPCVSLWLHVSRGPRDCCACVCLQSAVCAFVSSSSVCVTACGVTRASVPFMQGCATKCLTTSSQLEGADL